MTAEEGGSRTGRVESTSAGQAVTGGVDPTVLMAIGQAALIGSIGMQKCRANVQLRHLSSQAGFTLIEMLVVLGIIAMLAALTGPTVLGYLGKAKIETAKSQISAISTALELYALDNGSFPSQDEGLSALVQAPPNGVTWHGPYLKRAEGLIDPWGQPYQYKFPGRQGPPDVYSLGHASTPDSTNSTTSN